ncbi:MAG: hypothetical protein CSA09_03555 [Candidatus Contendobacter odensis]|uniref:Uncharacterized protein n=1 Tax=Candidatus Contendibacter odensensis TaxID=1400860 RepID=A0A2G6PF75_9GAMM|nr:MAG: hypothetical protein CSA09_03555 [Candidatus Contendobacter odensis]
MNRKERRALARKSAGSKTAAATEFVAQAIQLQQQGRLDEAKKLYRKTLQRDPYQVDALHFLGVMEAQQGRYQQAVDLIHRALALNPQYADAWNNLGNILATTKQPDEAAQAYRRAIEFAPENASAHCNLGAMLRQGKQYAEAEAACRQAIALNPQMVEALFNLGKVLTAQDHYEQAVDTYREVLRLHPGYIPVYRALGILLYRMGRSEDAIHLYQDWLRQDPDNAIAQHMLAAHSGQAIPDRATNYYVQNLFDDMADHFDEHLERLDYQAPTLVGQLVSRTMGIPKPSLTVLDAGCGTGLCGSFLRPHANHLTGVDLSPRMVERARVRGDYDELKVAELTTFLCETPNTYDLIISADTLVYFGDLQPVVTAAANALQPGGWLMFTTERHTNSMIKEDFHLEASGRYSHSEDYLWQILTQVGMEIDTLETVNLRMEGGQPIIGFLVSAHK